YGITFTPVYPTKYNVDSYKWLFGDGSSSKRRCPTHWYRDPGEYIVTMDLTFDSGLNAMKTQSINVTEFSDLQFLFRLVERDKDRVYFRLGPAEVVLTELSLLVSGMLAAVAVYVSFNDRRLYKGRYRESTATVVLRMIGIIWIMLAIILLIWIRMGGL
ncbi:MAG: PKD domain-containing protein, partial [Thermoplasmata archaeon]|nr:PKD domain-containing protein [Thermoplasmata archaeon]